ncbi:hypothetical protein J7T55_013717 [Diaporthe amygdali]|uniref:uncharacterized protein n=1 Tax=Phomopsis amygdali TaxID=1214568 RepID=UPI0022FEEB56|nr:uncharacterized protein J7T55_013717 [Diaporthe amygdali]KAJ0119515.1 hypothetical protein J7T55_013717 [Diaporthe amygdali]
MSLKALTSFISEATKDFDLAYIISAFIEAVHWASGSTNSAPRMSFNALAPIHQPNQFAVNDFMSISESKKV